MLVRNDEFSVVFARVVSEALAWDTSSSDAVPNVRDFFPSQVINLKGMNFGHQEELSTFHYLILRRRSCPIQSQVQTFQVSLFEKPRECSIIALMAIFDETQYKYPRVICGSQKSGWDENASDIFVAKWLN